MSFRSSRIEPMGDHEFKVHGDLMINAVTRPVVWHVEAAELGKDPWGNPRLGFRAELRLNRKDFGLTWNVALETGGWLVSDEVRVTAEIEAVPAPQDAVETAQAETQTTR
jgi:polyisoprenoid-binding protein YceI